MEKTLAWFKYEYNVLNEIKKKNETNMTLIKTEVQDLKQEAVKIRNEVNAE